MKATVVIKFEDGGVLSFEAESASVSTEGQVSHYANSVNLYCKGIDYLSSKSPKGEISVESMEEQA